jgi:predicted phosphate transport protein (TIGR00153 family)
VKQKKGGFMFRFLFKKQKEVENLIGEYVRAVEIAQEMFLQSMETYLQEGRCTPTFEVLVAETHKAESRCDDIQEKIVRLLFEKALVPDLRGDLLKLLETADEIPDQFDRVLAMVCNQKIVLPEALGPDVRELLTLSLEACSFAVESVRSLLERGDRAARLLFRTDQLESQGDSVEKRIIVHIFESDWDPLQKILLRDLTQKMGDIADSAVQVCRQINLIVIKRQV